MGRVCCVCGNTEVQQNEDILFFDFPISAYLRRKWKDVIQLAGRITYDTLVCSRHFEKSQYKTVKGKPRLVGRVVPSLYLNNKSNRTREKNSNSNENRLDSIENTLREKTEENIARLDTEINIDLISSLTCKEKSIEDSEEESSRNSPKPSEETDNLTNNSEDSSRGIFEKPQDVNEVSEKFLNSSAISENPTEISEKLQDSTKTCDKLQNASENSKKVQNSSAISENLQNSSKTCDKVQNASENSEKLQNLSEISEKLQNSSKTCDKLQNASENSEKLQNSSGNSEKLENTSSENNVLSDKEKSSINKSVADMNSKYFYLKDTNYQNGCQNVGGKTKSTPILPQPDPKEDIEDILTNYHIQNKGQLVMETDRVEDQGPGVQTVEESAPVFIEISVGRDPHSSMPSQEVPGNQDCLMVLESVQVDVDPSTFLLPEQEYDIAADDDDDDDVQITEDKKPDPISLLTSSDESDVILEEPKIDTVEVSDETDEDDVPLVRLLPKNDTDANTDIAKIMWGLYEYYCIQCKFYSTDKSDYVKHLKEHEKVLQMCQVCGYTTASKGQFERHRRKHRDDRRFKCHLCDYKARHKMSLLYHMKTHDGKTHKPGYSCHCGFQTNDKNTVLKHVRACKVDEPPKKYACKECSYSSNRRGDLKRHVLRKHPNNEDDDDEYLP